jgi:S-adenosylmethionine decarboxylase
LLNDLKKVEEILVAAAREANATVIESRFHKFSPFGISGVVVIAESHLTIHTWPEYGYAAVDVFTCGEVLKPEIAVNYMIDKFQSKSPSIVEVKRGLLSREGRLPHKPLKNATPEDDRTKELQMVS